MKKILILILAIISNPVFSDETFGDWEVSQTSDNTAFYASPSSKSTDEVMLVFYFFKRDECDVAVTALIPTDAEDEVEQPKEKKMLLTVDGDFYWGADKVLVSRKSNTVWVQLYANKDGELISELKQGRKLELKIGTMPIIEYSLMGAYKALTAAKIKCGVALGAEDLLK